MSSTRRGSEADNFTPSNADTSFIDGINDKSPLIQRERKREEAWREIKRRYPNVNPKKSLSQLRLINSAG
mgnify:CR=1 FL=1